MFLLGCLLSFSFSLLVFQDRVSLGSPGYPGTHSVDKADLKGTQRPSCFCLPSAGTKGVHHLAFVLFCFVL